MHRPTLGLLLATTLARACPPTLAQEGSPPDGGDGAGERGPDAEVPERPGRSGRAERTRGAKQDVVTTPTGDAIAWFGRWDDAKAEAARTGRPILLMSAAPQCQDTPGVW